ncbi:MAG: tRNA-dihydrouridine synthase family protein [Oscillospiraceae bacterium]|nr:tRNA-dihydrouridine synthase family protein [Oscillospiraceae bacterium]
MRYYYAPLEGITDATFRRLHHKYFPGVDRYFMPFISPTIHRCLTNREARELPKADSVGFAAVPQLLGKNVEDMLWAIEVCKDLGYDEVNINLGCPSGTVVSKGKGSGMLSDIYALDEFLSAIYAKAVLPVSLKTRIGVNDSENWEKILEIYRDYPVKELTVHPRIRKAFYKGDCDMDAFAKAVVGSPFPVCYNGNVYSMDDARKIAERFPAVESVMIGRGLVADPGMLCGGTGRETLKAFLNELSDTYCTVFESKRNAIYRMKDNWHYLIALFDGSDKLWKEMRKSTDYDRFMAIANEIITTLPMRAHPDIIW